MKKLIYLIFVIAVILLAACKTGSSKPGNENNREPDTIEKPDTMDNTTMGEVSVNEIAERYLRLKNSLGEDNAEEAAKAGTELEKTLIAYINLLPGSTGIDSLKELITDATEHAQHIGENRTDIGHQRQHFDFLSRDMYDLLKNDSNHKELYKVKCPMFNDGKGAFWISENGDNRNPYFGKSMPADGVDGEKI